MATREAKEAEEISGDAAAAAPSKSSQTIVARLRSWITASPKRAIVLAVACLLSVTTSATVWLVLAGHGREAEKPSLEPALAALDRREYDAARRLANQYKAAAPEDLTGGVDYVLGTAAASQTDASSSELKPARFLAAAKILEQARDHGFPPGREGDGLYWLGKCQFFCGQLATCRPTLREALKLNPARSVEIRYLLAEAYLGDAKPNPGLADEENRLALADRALTPDWRSKLAIQRVWILLAQGRRADALKTLEDLPDAVKRSGEALLARGQLWVLEARLAAANATLARQKYQQAIQTLHAAEEVAGLGSDVARKSMYLVGVCLLESGDPRGATAQFQRTARLFPKTAEAANGAFQEAELLRKAGSRDALPLYDKLLHWADADKYVNPWITLVELQEKMQAVYQDYLQHQDFEACLGLARAFHPLFPRLRAAELQAEVEMAWAKSLLAKANAADAAGAEALRREARLHLRRAGRHYEELARLTITQRRYPEELWNSAQAYLDGRDYRRGAEMLDQYLKNETRRRIAQALTSMGEALLAQGQLDQALKVLTNCIEGHPRDAASFGARLEAAKVYVEKADPAKAEALLRENLRADLLTPASAEWRESLFDLAALLYAERRYDDAVPRLDEAIQRYPQSPRAAEARYMAADACRQQGLQIRRSLERIEVQSTRVEQSRRADEYLASSARRLEQLCRTLLDRPETARTRSESLVLRNAYFALGEVLFALGRYEESAKAYGAVVRHFPDDPACLEAYVQIAAAYRRMNLPREARGAAEQAMVMLNRFKSDAELADTIRDRKQWADLLNRLTDNQP